MLRIIRDIYTDNKARVLLGQYLSPEFDIHSGVLQGSKLGPILFLIFINDLLERLNTYNLGAKLGLLIISSLGFADDIVLISDSPIKLQKLINICCEWAKENGMEFNTSKCKVMVLNRSSTNLNFTLNDELLEIVKIYKYLGISITTRRLTTLYTVYFSKILESMKILSK